MTNQEMWNLIVGFLLPPVLAIVQQRHWPSGLRSIVLFVVACAIAVPTVYWHGDITWHNWIKATLSILIAAIATYHGFWKPTNVAPSIEAATTIPPTRVSS